jgi:hypothetical protein
VRLFAEQWPGIDLSDYPSATGPGMHVAVATAAQLFGTGETTLQWLCSLFGVGLAATVAWRLAVYRRSVAIGYLLTLPLCLNPYFLGNSIWVMTDNASLWMLAIVLLGTTFVVATPSRLGRWSIAAAAACFVRQINVWVLPALVLSGWRSMRNASRDRTALSAATALAVVPAIAIVVGFVLLWGGLTPPQFHEYHAVTLQLSAVPFGLAALGTYGAPLWLAIGFGGVAFLRRPVAIVALLGWLVIAIVANNSTVSLEEGRIGGWIWTLVRETPVPGGRSVALTLLSLAGTLLAARLVDLATHRGSGPEAWLVVIMFAGFLAAHAANRVVAQRYFDAPALLTLAMLAALAWPRASDARYPGAPSVAHHNRWLIAFAMIATMQLVFASVTLFRPLVRNGPTPADWKVEGIGDTPWEESTRPNPSQEAERAGQDRMPSPAETR